MFTNLVKNNKKGSLINISSQMAHVGGIERAAIVHQNQRWRGLQKLWPLSGAPKIRINTICPTFILTPLTQASFDDPIKKKWILEKIKLGRAGVPLIVTNIYASDASNLVTGTSIMVDGGWTAD